MATYHIKNGGNDLADGLSDATAFATFSKAVSVITQGDTIAFKCGETYPPISINGLDGVISGKYYITNYGTGANPVISGFVTPTWTNQGNNIWSYTDSGLPSMVNLLKIGFNSPRHKGRLPETGYNTITSSISNTQISDNINLPSLPSVIGGELVSKKNKWILDTSTITAQTSTSITTSVASPYTYTSGYGYFVQNHQNCLTKNGDWYYNTTTKTIYIYYTSNPNGLGIKITKSEQCLNIKNSDYWEFFGIDFDGSNNIGAYIDSSNNVKFTRCSFNDHGYNGIQTWLSSYLTINSCIINYILNTGINNRDASPNLSVTNCYINNVAMIAGSSGSGDGQACGIKINNTEHNAVIRGNRLHNMGYIGVYYAGNNCLLEKNYAENGCMVKSDGALFYTFGSYTGIECNDNIGFNCYGNVDGTTHNPWAGAGDSAIFYFDDNSRNITFRRNYANGAQYGFYLHNNQNLIGEHNIAINNHVQMRLADDNLGDAISNINLQNNTFVALSNQFVYELRTIYTNLAFGTFNNNKIKSTDTNAYRIRVEPGAPVLENLSQWRSNRGYDVDSTLSDYDQEKELILVNETGGSELFELDAVYEDIAGVEHSGSIQLDENESIYLYRTGDSPPPVDEYTITLVSAPGGIATGGGIYEDGDTATLEAIPDTDYEFDGWLESGSVVSTSNPWAFVVNGDRTITPVFTEVIPPVEEYTVTVIDGTGGSVSGGGVYEDGDQATLTATPNTGWHFVRWSNDVTDNPYTFTVTGDVTLQAIFAQDDPSPDVIIVKGKFRIV